MSKEELTYEELQEKVGSLDKKFDKFIKIAQETKDENEDKNHEAKNNNDDKNHDAQNNDKKDEDEKMSNLIANIRTAQDMKDDDEDKNEAMKKAIEELEDYDKLTSKRHAKKGQNDKDDDEDADEDKKEMESKIASLENKTKEPIVKEILKVTSIVNPKGLKQITRELKTASLKDVEELYKHYKPFSASLGITESRTSAQLSRSIPFQLNAALENEVEDDDVLSASTRKEYAKIDTEKLYDRVTEMYS